MLRFGPEGGPAVIAALPLFEEANRTRAFVVAILRALATRGIGGVLPDLPGQGESLVPTVDARLASWRFAFAAAAREAGSRHYVFAVRSGALIDGEADAKARLHLAPEHGRDLVRDLFRARRAAALANRQKVVADDPGSAGPPLHIAGNLIDRALLQALTGAEPDRADRRLELFPSSGSADRLLAPCRAAKADGDLPRFRAPWRGAEPFVDDELVTLLADDIAGWIAACEG